MFRFTIRNLLTKKAQAILIMLSIIISASVSGIAVNISNQVEDGITGTAGWYSLIIGPAGSATQLAMNTMYFTDKPLGTIPKELYAELKKDSRVKDVIPYAMADSYDGYNLVGTQSAYLASKEVAQGKMFDDASELEVVLGSDVAKATGRKVGDTILTSHSEGEEHDTPFTVVGILEESGTVYDSIVFTQIKSIWEVHEHEEHDHDEEDEEHEHEHGVCAYLIKTNNPAQALQLKVEYDGKVLVDDDGDSCALQAIEPMETVRAVLDDMDTTKKILSILCTVILMMNILVIIIITLLNMYHAKDEIKLMRLIGISIKKINLMYLIQNCCVGLMSILGAFLFSRIGLALISGYVRSMGVSVNIWKVYGSEIGILFVVFVLSTLPTVICTTIMSKRRDVI